MTFRARSRARSPGRPPILGVDTGGTFTDLVLADDSGTVRSVKVPSTPDDPARALLAGVRLLCDGDGGGDGGGKRSGEGGAGDDLLQSGLEVIHGTTVALNALLTGRTARTALVTNAGFRDLLEIGRQERPDIYSLHPRKPAPLVPRERRFEVHQRSWPDGQGGILEVSVPSSAELLKLVRAVQRSRAESVAVCLLTSYADPSIEERVAAALAPLGIPITCSAAILPAYREIERFSTAVVNAALVPVLGAYLERLGKEFDGHRLSVLQSSGGTLEAAAAAREPVRVLFSGPAGGVVGAGRAAAQCGLSSIVTLDMGGTSTDVAFRDADAENLGTVNDAVVAGHPIAVPALDIHTIGCGGGSLVRVDAGGVLHVGPESAGADPGPVCYGRGEEPTVTDAHVLLGHIAPQAFLNGTLELDEGAVQRAFERLAERLGSTPADTAAGVLEVARAALRRAVGVMTMQRGMDPKALPLVAFGGGGGLHAAALARSLGMPGALVPAQPGVLSALGMTTADALRDHQCTVLAPLADWGRERRGRALKRLAETGRQELREAGHAARAIRSEYSLELRYRGQSYELTVPEGRSPAQVFAFQHEERYGWRMDAGEVELVTLRARAVVRVAPPVVAGPQPRRRARPAAAVVGTRRAWFEQWVECERIDRSRLAPGHVVQGPAIVEEYSVTTLVPP
ncbi:MAG: hydantoinase/oxoprolinase family protein [Planctomycetota bacterium]